MPLSQPDSSKWISWNIMFPPGSNDAFRAQQIDVVKDYIKNYLAMYNFMPSYYEIYCPCDSSLYNLNVTPVPLSGSGQAYNPPTPPPPPHGGSGDNIPYIASLNNRLVVDSPSQNAIDPNSVNYAADNKFALNNVGTNSRILAIMDTGLDPDYFDSKLGKLIWTDPGGRTLRNFTFNAPAFTPASSLDYFQDDNLKKHGTAVATIALEAMGNVSSYPKIMVLKVLDSKESGTTFNVGCALSYAIKNHATIINASLGYYDTTGISDPVLAHYLNRCNTPGTDSIFVFAAAGNLPLPHDPNLLCKFPVPASNELLNGPAAIRLFYPASFSDNLNNVISITGLRDLNQSCVYQNYSARYVTLGVLNNSQNCCAFFLKSIKPSQSSGFEGSSFATPVFSGKVMANLINVVGAAAPTVRQSINFVTHTISSLLKVTRDGRFIDNSNQ